MKKLFILFILSLFTVSGFAKSDEKAFVSRIQFGYDFQRYHWQGGNDKAHGFDLGYLANIKVAKSVPIYVYTGLIGSADFDMDWRRHIGIELPFGATYRLRLGDTKIYISPYAGFHIKTNAMWQEYQGSGDWENMFDYSGAKRAQFGAQAGFNFDLGAFFWNFEFNGDFNKAYKYYSSECGTMGVRLRIGFVF